MGVSKVVYGDNTLVDLTGDTVAAEKMLSGTTAHDKAGNPITGTIPTVEQATPKLYCYSNGQIIATATQPTGYVQGGTKTVQEQLTVQAAQTITPGTTDQTIASGVYLTGKQTIKGDANLVPENIASGVSIFGVEGTMEAGGGGSSGGIDGDMILTVRNNTDVNWLVNGRDCYVGESASIPIQYGSHSLTAMLTFWAYTTSDGQMASLSGKSAYLTMGGVETARLTLTPTTISALNKLSGTTSDDGIIFHLLEMDFSGWGLEKALYNGMIIDLFVE